MGNQVDEALDMIRRWTPGEWKLTGPTSTNRSYVINAGNNQIAIVSGIDVSPAEVLANARAMLRARELTGVLEHIQTELEGDDDGTRWADLLRMIADELKHQPLK